MSCKHSASQRWQVSLRTMHTCTFYLLTHGVTAACAEPSVYDASSFRSFVQSSPTQFVRQNGTWSIHLCSLWLFLVCSHIDCCWWRLTVADGVSKWLGGISHKSRYDQSWRPVNLKEDCSHCSPKPRNPQPCASHSNPASLPSRV